MIRNLKLVNSVRRGYVAFSTSLTTGQIATGSKMIELCKKHTIFSWAAQKDIDPIPAVRAEGIYFWDENGKRYTDLSSQRVCSNIGHGHPKMVQAIADQAKELAYVDPSMATPVRAQLGELLAKYTPGGSNGQEKLDKFVFTTGGAETNEIAARIARNYTGRQKIISRYRSYHGSTHLTSNLTGESRRWDSEPGVGFIKIFDPYEYRSHLHQEGDTDKMFTQKCLEQLEETLMYENPNTVAAIFLETVTGTNGIIIPPDGYLKGVRDICDKYGIMMVCDEVMCGMGRTGKWFAVEHWDVVPDILSIAKGISSAYLPLGALAVKPSIASIYDNKIFPCGSTYQNHPMCLAAGVASIKIMEEEDIVGNSQMMGYVLQDHHVNMFNKHPSVGDTRALGLFGCLELVKNRETKEPMAAYGQTSEPMMKLKKFLWDNGIYTMLHRNFVHTSPPLCINKQQLDETFEIIDKALNITDEYVE